MCNIAFFDIDGTLLRSDGSVDEDNCRVVHELHERNIQTFIASGRLPNDVLDIMNKTGISSAISLNGQYILHDGKCIYQSPLEQQHCIEIATFCKENNLIYGFHTPHYHYVSNGDEHVTKPYNHSSTPLVDEDIHLKEDVFQGLLYCESHWIPIAQEAFPHFKFVQWGDMHYDVLPLEVSKASAISTVLSVLNLSKQDAYAFGDGLNDVEMFKHVGTSIAMGNAVPTLKEYATFVTKTNDERGIRFAFEQLKVL